MTNNERVNNRAELEPLIEAELRKRSTREWQDLFEGSGLPYAAINDVQGTMNHEHGTWYFALMWWYFIDIRLLTSSYSSCERNGSKH